jgi:hypothetical protein
MITYEFKPKKDISAYELAVALKFASHQYLQTDQRLPDRIARHFEVYIPLGEIARVQRIQRFRRAYKALWKRRW